MRKHFLAATIVAAMSAPVAAQAQNTVGVAGPSTGTVIVDSGVVGIAADQRPAFREYIVHALQAPDQQRTARAHRRRA